jgi:ABC-2 type transport system permease protein
MGKIRFIALKELRHILRDPRSLFIAILMPIVMTFLYGYAINLDIKNIRLSIIDYDKTPESRELAREFYNNDYFTPALMGADLKDPERVLKLGKAHAVLTIPQGLAESIHNRTDYELGILIDGADANMAAAASSYSGIIVGQFVRGFLPHGFEVPGVKLSQQVLYNPDLVSSHFFVPGLIAIFLMMISALLTSVTIAREKETGTIEQLLTSPITPRMIIVGKVLPYVGLAFLDGIIILLLAVFHFGVPFVGPVAVLVLFGIIYVIAALSLGVLISTLVSTQQVAMMTALIATVLPSVMLSGFIFEIKNMPPVLQWLSYIVPARYFLVIIRGIMLKGAGIGVLWHQAAALILITLILLIVATKRFRLRLG